MGSAASISNDEDITSTYKVYKRSGDEAYKINMYSEAIYWYSQAIYLLKDDEADGQIALAIIFSNRSSAFLLNAQPIAALSDAERSIQLNPRWPKAYYRAAVACAASSDPTTKVKATEYIESALLLSPTDNQIRKLHSEISTNADVLGSKCVDSGAYSWGSGSTGQLGLGDRLHDKSTPTAINSLAGKYIVDASCGYSHSACVTAIGQVYTWGSNKYHQLGLGSISRSHSDGEVLQRDSDSANDCMAVPTRVPGLVGLKVVAVSCGAGHTVCICEQGRSYAWGINQQGQLGIGLDSSMGVINNVSEPQLVMPPANGDQAAVNQSHIVSVACGIAHTFYLHANGSVSACGLNNYGQLGLRKTESASVFWVPTENYNNLHRLMYVPVHQGRSDIDIEAVRVTHIACGGAHTLVIDSDGALLSCGSNSCGQLGNGKLDDCDRFVVIDSAHKFAYCACGEEYSAAISQKRPGAESDVFLWGLGIVGQIGDGNLENRASPTKVLALSGKDVEMLTCSQGQVLAVTRAGEVWTWGLPGDRTFTASSNEGVNGIMKSPVRVSTLSNRRKVRHIACGRKHYMMLATRPYAPMCHIIGSSAGKGNGSIDSFRLTAGKRKSLFDIQAIDNNGDIYTSGGSKFIGTITPLTLDHELKVKLQLSDTQYQAFEAMTVDFEDNFCGTYTVVFRCMIAGSYSLSIMLDELEIKDSPVELTVEASDVSPRNCIVWWGRYAVASSSPEMLLSAVEESVVFTVSCRDVFNNKCWITSSYYVEVVIYSEERLEGEDTEEHHSSAWRDSSSGVFPCMFKSPSKTGRFKVTVRVLQNDDVETRAPSSGSYVKGSPFSLAVTDTAGGEGKEKNSPEENQEKSREHCTSEFLVSEEERKPFAEVVERQEATRRRAELALRRQQNKLAVERELKKKDKAVKRIGGGFLISYSKDI